MLFWLQRRWRHAYAEPPKPVIGEIVHYRLEDGCRVAIVTAVHDGPDDTMHVPSIGRTWRPSGAQCMLSLYVISADHVLNGGQTFHLDLIEPQQWNTAPSKADSWHRADACEFRNKR